MAFAQRSTEERLRDIEDRIALKELVDTFSNLADVKDVATQMNLFTDNATVDNIMNGQVANTLTGKKQIGDAFSGFLALFDVVYHINGQQTVALNGDNAKGTSYCMVTLIGKQNGKSMKTTMGVYYNDTFVRQNGKWLIANRRATFAWQEVKPLGE